MKASVFVDKVVDIATNYKTLYVMGCFGAPMTAANKARYTKNHKYNMNASRVAMINAASADTFGFDCVNLIKGVLWGWSGDKTKGYGGAIYPTTAAVLAGACPDIGADSMIKICSGVTTDFSGIVPGAAVWCSGHIGVYIGGGLAVECTPKWENKVQITAVGNIGKKAGYNTRTWVKWGKIPYIDYMEGDEMTKDEIKAIVSETVKAELKATVREVVKEVIDEENPIYKDLENVPDYWRGAAAMLLDAGAINGGTPAEVNATDLNIRRETLKAAIVAAIYHEAREREGGVPDSEAEE